MCYDSRYEWKDYTSVLEASFKITGVYPTSFPGIYRYVDEIDRCGFLTEEHILTKPLYTAHVIPRDEEHGLFVVTLASGHGSNRLALLDFADNCKVILEGFSASFMLNETWLAYRVDDDKRQWPKNMDWGVFDLETREEVMKPQCFVPCFENGGLPIESKLKRMLAS